MMQLSGQLEKYHRMNDPALKEVIARRVGALEKPLVTGNEKEALEMLLRNVHYRGTDIRLFVEYNDRKEMVPYIQHIAGCGEMCFPSSGSTLGTSTSLKLKLLWPILRQASNFHTRHMIVVDSQVLYFALGKGRSPSRRLNRILKRVTALALMTDTYLFPIWTLSAWNHADNPSRRA